MTLDTVEKLLRQADRLTPNEKLLLANRLIERVRPRRKLMTAKDLLNSGLVGMWAKRRDMSNRRQFASKLRAQSQTRGRTL
jgi:hypothetical protein